MTASTFTDKGVASRLDIVTRILSMSEMESKPSFVTEDWNMRSSALFARCIHYGV
jgi:hypothetical protein